MVTTILANGTSTLAKAGAIVKRLRSVETLGSTSAINSDKTGTLTLNQMTAVQMAIAGQRFTITGEGYSTVGNIQGEAGRGDVPLERYLLPMALCADAVAKDGQLVGDPTEGALVVLAAKGGVDPVLTREKYPRIAEVPFDAAYKFMATFHEMQDEAGKPVVRAYVKGAPDQLLARAANAIRPDGGTAPSPTSATPYLAENDRLGSQGLRVMATGYRDFDPATFDRTAADLLPLVKDLTLLALVGIVDPPRPEARDAIAIAHAAGIQVRMITGDHAVTAEAIARQLGITGRAITGAEFAAMDDDTLRREIDGIGVIARVAPEDKVHLVDILKSKGHIVAMTGDGVNDAPALKKADIGVAMGITGTEVSKEAAVMILTDDNFATIVKAVELGRALYDNLVRYIRFQMAGLFGFIGTFLGAAILFIAQGMPFLPLQTLWVNFTVQVFLAIGLGYGKAREGLMKDAPRSPHRPDPRHAAARLPRVHRRRHLGAHAGRHRVGHAGVRRDRRPDDGPHDVRVHEHLVRARDRGRGRVDVLGQGPRQRGAAQDRRPRARRDARHVGAGAAQPDPRHGEPHHRPVADRIRRVARGDRRGRDQEAAQDPDGGDPAARGRAGGRGPGRRPLPLAGVGRRHGLGRVAAGPRIARSSAWIAASSSWIAVRRWSSSALSSLPAAVAAAACSSGDGTRMLARMLARAPMSPMPAAITPTPVMRPSVVTG